MTSLHLIRRRDRLEFKVGRNAVLYRSQKSGVRYMTKPTVQLGSMPASPAGMADLMITPTASLPTVILSQSGLTLAAGAVGWRLGAIAAGGGFPVRHCNV